MPSWAQAMEQRLTSHMDARADGTERELLDRMNRLEDRIVGAIALAAAADQTAAGAEVASLERDMARGKAMASLSEVLVALQRQVIALDHRVRELRDGKRLE